MKDLDIQDLLEFNRLARKDGKKYKKKRFLFPDISSFSGKHFVGIAGPRGVGKTVILKQLALETPDSFYISLDTFNGDLFKLVKNLNSKLGIKVFLLDEIHFNSACDEGLKKIYDFLDVRVVFTSSVSFSLFKSSRDLSRRVIIKKLYPFSFREFLFFTESANIKALDFEDILNKGWDKKILHYSDRFEHYLKGGNMPFSLHESEPLTLLENILNTVIVKDIPSLQKIAVDEIETIKQVVEFTGKSEVDGINYSSISDNLKITKYKAKQYVSLLEKAFILMRVMPAGTNVMKEPKILMALPYRLLFQNYASAIGPLREDFFVEAVLSAKKEIKYLKSTRGSKTPDYIIKNKEGTIIVEVGGKGKGREQFKGIKEKKKLILTHSLDTTGIKRPLLTAGLL
ncbi:MAG: ATP-binding protein [Elusimicrobiota bacterium]